MAKEFNSDVQKYIKLHLKYYPKLGKVYDKNKNKVITGHDKNGYYRIHINGTYYSLAVVIWFMVYGAYPDGIVRYKNGIPTDIRIDNLYSAKNLVNTATTHKGKKHGVTIYPNGRITANIRIDNKCIYLGTYKTRLMAALRYKSIKDKLTPELAESLVGKDKAEIKSILNINTSRGHNNGNASIS